MDNLPIIDIPDFLVEYEENVQYGYSLRKIEREFEKCS